jgi:hypothetical protein
LRALLPIPESARAAGVFVVCATLYVATLTPGLAHLGGDGHELTVVAATLGLAHPTGYPLYTWIGHLFTLLPIGEVAYRMNLMSAILGAAGVAVLYLVARRLALAPGIAVFTALLFGVSTTFWSQAVITEVYAPNVLAVALVLWLVLRWAERPAGADRLLVGCTFACGLSLGMHFSNLGFVPAVALFVWLTDRRILTRQRTVAAAGLAFAAGAAQFVWLPLRAHAHDLFPNAPPDTPAEIYRYTLGAFANLRFAFPLADALAQVAAYVRLLTDNFGLAGVVAGVAGVWALRRRDPRACCLLLSMYAIHVVVFSQLFVPDREPFFVASNLLFALFVGSGLEALRATIVAHNPRRGRRPSRASAACCSPRGSCRWRSRASARTIGPTTRSSPTSTTPCSISCRRAACSCPRGERSGATSPTFAGCSTSGPTSASRTGTRARYRWALPSSRSATSDRTARASRIPIARGSFRRCAAPATTRRSTACWRRRPCWWNGTRHRRCGSIATWAA